MGVPQAQTIGLSLFGHAACRPWRCI